MGCFASRENESKITAEYVRSVLDYNAATGEFVWKVQTSQIAQVGRKAGCCSTHKRRKIGLKGRHYAASRVAVLWMTGKWPDGLVDHIDRDVTNDRWSNLRVVTVSGNTTNRIYERKNGLPRGVVARPRADGSIAYRARLGRGKNLGTFGTPEEAHAAYLRHAKRAYGDLLPIDLRQK